MAAHVVLALVMSQYPIVGVFHAVACLAGGLVYAATTRRIRNVTVIVAYIAGCEVLWRMTKVGLFWEFGKYTTIAFLLVALTRIKWPRNRALALAYFGLLLPSIALSLQALPFNDARQLLSFNLAGPLAIAMAVMFFSNIRLRTSELRHALIAFVGPVAGIGAVAFAATQRSQLEFINASNSITSGGFGPNQVSASLGLAVMFLLLMCFERAQTWRVRVPLLALGILLASQAALTFARGGLLLAFGGAAMALFVLVRGNLRVRLTVLATGLLVSALGKFVVEPRLEEFTSGKLGERYSNLQSSGRDDYVRSELDMFEESPILGVGPGVGLSFRAERGMHEGASHTEYTRMLGEHGVLGILSLICLSILGVRAMRRDKDLWSRALASAFVVWAAAFLAIYGTRIVAPALVFGLAFAVQPAALEPET